MSKFDLVQELFDDIPFMRHWEAEILRDLMEEERPERLLEKTGLAHRVTPLFCKRSDTWELQRMINAPDRPRFDFCYLDGGHTWDVTGFGILPIDMLLRPGGLLLLLLDDMDWTMRTSKYYQSQPERVARFDEDEIDAKPVRIAWDTILKHLGYEQVREYPKAHWGLARKPS